MISLLLFHCYKEAPIFQTVLILSVDPFKILTWMKIRLLYPNWYFWNKIWKNYVKDPTRSPKTKSKPNKVNIILFCNLNQRLFEKKKQGLRFVTVINFNFDRSCLAGFFSPNSKPGGIDSRDQSSSKTSWHVETYYFKLPRLRLGFWNCQDVLF
jgi:hypothetical protein